MGEARGQVHIAPSEKRVRVFLGGVCIVDSRDALYVWEGPRYPQYYLSLHDFAVDVLERSTTVTTSPSRGTATHFTVRAGGREAIDAAWCYEDSQLSELRDRVRLDWEAMDAWFEEDEEVFIHPRDPSTRVQILPSSRHVVVAVDGLVVADSCRTSFLYETGLPRRTYIPKPDIRMDRLEPTDSRSGCPYKGTARYWTVRTDDARYPYLAWSYPAPLPESAPIAGLVAYYDEAVDLTIDGELQSRPRTHFSVPQRIELV
jgi:uncharacterized protein (DUF427 family)